MGGEGGGEGGGFTQHCILVRHDNASVTSTQSKGIMEYSPEFDGNLTIATSIVFSCISFYN